MVRDWTLPPGEVGTEGTSWGKATLGKAMAYAKVLWHKPNPGYVRTKSMQGISLAFIPFTLTAHWLPHAL